MTTNWDLLGLGEAQGEAGIAASGELRGQYHTVPLQTAVAFTMENDTIANNVDSIATIA